VWVFVYWYTATSVACSGHVGVTNVGCRYMKRQLLVELFYNIYYSCTLYTDELEFEELKNNNNNSELCNTLNVVLNATLN
jgi:hypothetical protein